MGCGSWVRERGIPSNATAGMPIWARRMTPQRWPRCFREVIAPRTVSPRAMETGCLKGKRLEGKGALARRLCGRAPQGLTGGIALRVRGRCGAHGHPTAVGMHDGPLSLECLQGLAEALIVDPEGVPQGLARDRFRGMLEDP